MPLDVEKIRKLRLKQGLTLQQAADRAGMKTRQAWSRIESGGQPNLGIQHLDRIAKVLGVKARVLLT